MSFSLGLGAGIIVPLRALNSIGVTIDGHLPAPAPCQGCQLGVLGAYLDRPCLMDIPANTRRPNNYAATSFPNPVT
jgi:hypothetical protein